MNLASLFKRKGFPLVTLCLTALTTLLSFAVLLRPEWFDRLCYATRPADLWQYLSGCFVHGIEPQYAFFLHLGLNLLGLVPLGILIEKLLGRRKTFTLFLVSWLVSSILFQLITWNDPGQACGVSAIVYAFAPVAFFSVFSFVRKHRIPLFRQPIAYYFLFEAFGLLTMLNPMSGAVSLIMHASGLLLGIAACICWKKEIAGI